MIASERSEPILIQGGMGVAVSGWQLARAVSKRGQLGVVSGTAIDSVLARRLQMGDPSGDLRRALAEFPYQPMADRILARYFVPGGKSAHEPFSATTVLPVCPSQEQVELVVVANFVEVFLAKEGHDGLVGINLLEKIQTPTLASLYGAMLADVDYVLMGAGIPRTIPGILDRFAQGEPANMAIYVDGADANEVHRIHFSPAEFTQGEVPWLKRPKFLAIVASATLASMLAKKADGYVDGFVIEGPSAGGHNAPPRGTAQFNAIGEPIYGDRDVVDLRFFRELGRPFWLAGSYGTPDKLAAALSAGAAGIQVGTAFAYCRESGLDDSLKQRVIELVQRGEARVFTDPVASPTGFPFKVLGLTGSMSEAVALQDRHKVCDLGYLRHAHKMADGSIVWRCPGEPTQAYFQKDGCEADTVGRKCVCNGLMAAIGLAQCRKSGDELPLVTCGNDVNSIAAFLPNEDVTAYSASDVIDHLMSAVQPIAP